MKKILLIANSDWYLYNYRLSLANFLRENGYQVVLVSSPGPYVPLIQASGFNWIAWKLSRHSIAPWREIQSILDIARIIRRENPTLIHNHTIKAVIYGSLAAHSVGLQQVVNSITGRGYVFLNNKITTRLIRGVIKILYRVCVDQQGYFTIFENETDRELFRNQNMLVSTRNEVIPGVGVDVSRFLPTPEPEGTPVVLYPGRFLWDKGVGVLVEAARHLHGRASVRIVLVGKPDPGNPSSIDEAQIKSWVEQEIVEWWGWQDDMHDIYARCHVVVLPSFSEGIPTVLLEALASARPVVASDVPGCRDVVKHGVNGLLVLPHNPQALADAIYQLISDGNLRDRMGKAGHDMVAQQFSIERINQMTLSLYRQVG